MSRGGVDGLRQEGLKIGGLFLVLVVASYGQQAFLWDAALNCVYKIRVHVFDRVLERDLVFFESGNGVSSGDIAYRITAEASEVADTVYALLNVSENQLLYCPKLLLFSTRVARFFLLLIYMSGQVAKTILSILFVYVIDLIFNGFFVL